MAALIEADGGLPAGLVRLTRVSVVFALGATLGKVVGLVMLPILTRALSPSEFGSMDVLMSLGTALTATLMFGLDVATLRLYFDQEDKTGRRRLVGTWVAVALTLTTLAATVIAAGSAAISEALFSTSRYQPAVVAIAVILVTQTIEIVVLTVLRAQERPGWFAIINGGVLLLYAGLTVVLLAWWQTDANAVLVALATAFVVFAVLGVLVVRHELVARPTIAAAESLLRLGLPLAPAVAATLAADFVNRAILLGSAGAADVAFFTVALRFASVAALAVTGFQLAWQPHAYALGTSDQARIQLAAEGSWIMSAVCAVTLVLAVASPEVLELAAGPRYALALPTLGVCLVAVLGSALYLIASLPSSIARKTQDLAMATGASVIVAITGNVILAPSLQSLGTAVAVAAGQFAGVATVAILGRRRLLLPFEWQRIAGQVGLTALLVVALLAGNASMDWRLAVGALGLAWTLRGVPLGRALALARRQAGENDSPKCPFDHAATEATPLRLVTDTPGPALVVRVPGTYLEERRYILDTMLGEWLGLTYAMTVGEAPQTCIQLVGDGGERRLIVPDVLFATRPDDWLSERALPALPLDRLAQPAQMAGTGCRPVSTAPGPLPVLFGLREQAHAWQESATGLALSIDVFGSVFFMITRYEELPGAALDRHARFPAASSLAALEGFLERPIVDEYVDLLWAAMRSLWPTLDRRLSPFRLMVTHDVDEAWATYGRRARVVAHAVAGDLVRRHDPVLGGRRCRAFVDARRGRVDRDPFNTFDFLMDTSELHGLTSTFYFMTGDTASDIDGHYRLTDPPTATLLRRIHDRGHVIGLHLSYDSYMDPVAVRHELEVLQGACRALGFDQSEWGARQHFLRFRSPETWAAQDAVGIDHDSTVGFPEHIGYRAGTCREYQTFDLGARRKLTLRERPIIAMDGTVTDYMGLDESEGAKREIALVDTCRRFGGIAVVCHHNISLLAARQRAQYRELISRLAHEA